MLLSKGAMHQNLRDESYAFNERGHRIFCELGDTNGLASALAGFGEVALADGDLHAPVPSLKRRSRPRITRRRSATSPTWRATQGSSLRRGSFSRSTWGWSARLEPCR